MQYLVKEHIQPILIHSIGIYSMSRLYKFYNIQIFKEVNIKWNDTINIQGLSDFLFLDFNSKL